MNRINAGRLLALAIGAMTLTGAQAAPLVLSFSNEAGHTLNFNGASGFVFDPTTSFDLKITNSSSGVGGNAVGLLGDIDSPLAPPNWVIGTVVNGVGGVQTAPVTGSGKLTLYDVSGTLTADLTWDEIQTFSTLGQVNPGLFGVASLNLTNFVKTGTLTSSDLNALYNSPAATVQVSFNTPGNVSYLKANVLALAYSGTITAVPEPLYSGLVLVGAVGLLISFRRRRQPETESGS